MEKIDTGDSKQDWKKKVADLHELLRQMALDKHNDRSSFITTIDKMAEDISTLTSQFEKVLNDYKQLEKFVKVLNEALRKLSAQNRDVHQMILAVEDELSEAKSTIVTMENRYGQHAVQMINKWTTTGHGFYEEEIKVPQVVIEAEEAEELQASSSGNKLQSEDETPKLLLDTKKKRKRKRSSSRIRRSRRELKAKCPDPYLNVLQDRDSRLVKASTEIAALKVEIEKLKTLGDKDNSAHVHSMADNLMGQVLKIGQIKNDLESFIHSNTMPDSSATSFQSSMASSPRDTLSPLVIQKIVPSTRDKIVQVPSQEVVAADYTSFIKPSRERGNVNVLKELPNTSRLEQQDSPIVNKESLLTLDNVLDSKSTPESYLAQTETVTEHLEEVLMTSKTETTTNSSPMNDGKLKTKVSRMKIVEKQSVNSLTKKLSTPSRLSLPKIRDVAAIDGKLYIIHDKKEEEPPVPPGVEQHQPPMQHRPPAPTSLLACRESPKKKKKSIQSIKSEKHTPTKEIPNKSNSRTKHTPTKEIPNKSNSRTKPASECAKTEVVAQSETRPGTEIESETETELAEWVTMKDYKRMSQDQPLTKASISNTAHMEEESVVKEKDNPVTNKPVKRTPRPLRHNSRPTMLLHYHFSPKMFPKHITATEPRVLNRNQQLLSHFAQPQPLGLSMRKVDLQPRSMDKSSTPLYSGYSTPGPGYSPPGPGYSPPGSPDYSIPLPSTDGNPHLSKPSTPNKYRNGLFHRQQYSRRDDVNEVSKYWQLRFDSPKKSYDTMLEFPSDMEYKNAEGLSQGQFGFDTRGLVNTNVASFNRRGVVNANVVGNSNLGMPVDERRYYKKRKKRRFIDTL